MATLADPGAAAPASAEQRERRFFLGMAVLIAVIVVAGFGGYILAGISSFDAPWWVHFHAVTYMGWIWLFLLQNLLITRGLTTYHHRLGRMMAGWALLMVAVGSALLVLSIGAHRAPPPVFTAGMLIVMDELAVLTFAALVAAGLALRRRTDWHRRLMLSATVCIIAPAIGRLTVLTIGFSWSAIIVLQLALLALPMVRDWRIRGRVHPALWWGAGSIAGIGLLSPPLADLPVVSAFAASLAGG